MANEVATSKPAGGLSFQVPAHIAAKLKAAGPGNIGERNTTNSLTFPGKVWTINVNGESKVLQRKNEDGDLENVQNVKLFVLAWEPNRERLYYAKQYDPANAGKAPDCWSRDGHKPHPSVPEPVSSSCETCPMAAKGSRIANGREMVACGQFRTLVVIPANNLEFPALKLRLSVTSDYDGRDDESMSAGWYAWKQFVDHLRAGQVNHTYALVTRVRFANVEHPKLQFARGDFVDEATFDKLHERANSDEVKKLLEGFTPSNTAKPATGKPLPKDEDEADHSADAAIAAAKAATAEAAKAEAAQSAVEAIATEKRKAAAAERKRKAEEAAAAAKAAAEAAKAAEEDGDWDGPAVSPPKQEIIPPKKDDKPPSRAAKTAAADVSPIQPAEISGDVAALLDAWE